MSMLKPAVLMLVLLAAACADDASDAPVQGPSTSLDGGRSTGSVGPMDGGIPTDPPRGREPGRTASRSDGGHLRRDGGKYDFQYDPPDFHYDQPDFHYDPADFDDGQTINGYKITRYGDGRVLIETPGGESCERSVGTGGGLSFHQDGSAESVSIRVNDVLVVASGRCAGK